MAFEWPYDAEIRRRRRDFEKLLDRLTTQHEINDRDGLGRAVDAAMRIYHGRDRLNKDDAKQLLKHIPKVTEILAHGDNDTRIASVLMQRDHLLIKGRPYNWKLNGEIIMRLWQINEGLSSLARVLRQGGPGRTPNVQMLGMVTSLKQFWARLPDKKPSKTFTPNDPKVRRQHARKFFEAIVQFIDPEAVKKLPSAMRGRLK
jgi:hypothetical protein